MRRLPVSLLAVSFGFAAAVPAFAGSQDGAVIAAHVKAHEEKATNICATGMEPVDPVSQGIACSDFNVNAETLTSLDVYLVVGQSDPAEGIGGFTCGIAYGGNIGMFGWTLCSDLDFPSGPPDNPAWPASGAGNRITWATATNCQRNPLGDDGGHAVGGAFYIYAYGDGVLSVTTNNTVESGAELKVADCQSAESDISEAAVVGFGTMTGCNPCTDECAVPVEPTSWGQIKSRFE